MMDDGLYFGLPESDYHALPRLSASGIKRLLVSLPDFYEFSWMNPNHEPPEKDGLVLGKASHMRIVEGKEAFYAAYVEALDPDDYPDALKTIDDMKIALKKRELPITGNKSVLTARLVEASPNLQVWDGLKTAHAVMHEGKTLLKHELIARIEIAAAMIEKHPQLQKCFTGGEPEVSILWTDEETSVRMKTRLDYLKPRAICELKTFSNPLNKPIDRAITTAIASYRYHIQAAVNLIGVEHARGFIRDGAVHGGEGNPLCDALMGADDFHYLFIFQKTGPAPLARGKEWPVGMMTHRLAEHQVAEMQRVFAEAMERFGDGPWLDDEAIETLADEDLPPWIGD